MTSGHIAMLMGWREGQAKNSNHSTCKYYNTIDTQFALIYKKSYMYMIVASGHLWITLDWSPVQTIILHRGRCHWYIHVVLQSKRLSSHINYIGTNY